MALLVFHSVMMSPVLLPDTDVNRSGYSGVVVGVVEGPVTAVKSSLRGTH